MPVSISTVLDSLSGFVAPRTCPACASRPTADEAEICPACMALLEKEIPTPRCPLCGGALDTALASCAECLRLPARPWNSAVSAFLFEKSARKLVHRFKYRNEPHLAAFFARRMVANWKKFGNSEIDCVVPVPLHWAKYLYRGYNQAELLAARIAKEMKIPLLHALRRQRFGRQQAKLDFAGRCLNVKGIFAPRRNVSLAGRHILLVDDVITTGATLGEATKSLLGNDAETVHILTVARG